jgi:hypothetical protein
MSYGEKDLWAERVCRKEETCHLIWRAGVSFHKGYIPEGIDGTFTAGIYIRLGLVTMETEHTRKGVSAKV